MEMNYFYVILSLLLSHQLMIGHSKDHREKRYLVFTPSTQFGMFVTVSIPLHPDSTVSVAWFFEANYYNVDNATYFEPLLGDIALTARNKEERSVENPKEVITRSSFYAFLESMLQKHGYPGRPCLLRAICENASEHFLHNGVLGDLLHVGLTPSTSMSEDSIEDGFYEAEYYGLEHRCEEYAADCPASPLDYISSRVETIL